MRWWKAGGRRLDAVKGAFVDDDGGLIVVGAIDEDDEAAGVDVAEGGAGVAGRG